MKAEFLEDFLRASPEYQGRYIASLREIEAAQERAATAKREFGRSLEERWQRIPKWRRAIILAAQWIQRQLTPNWL